MDERRSVNRPWHAAGERKATVAVVSPHRHLRSAVQRLLTVRRYEVIDAPTYERAVELAREQQRPLDVVVLDVHVGAEELRGLRHRLDQLGASATRVLLSSALDRAAVAAVAADSGSVHLSKPFTPEALVASIDAALAGRPAFSEAV